jgi:uncharacterized damage-inducible protein DinB
VDKIAAIKENKEAAYQALRELLDGLERGDWDHPVYGHEQGWTVRDLLTHLVTAGPGLLRAAQLTTAGQLKMRPDFDLDFWNQRQVEKQAGRTIPQLLDGLAALNQDTLAYLDTLTGDESEAILSRTGHHAVFGEISVEYILRRVYQHEQEHTGELRQALRRG